MVRRNSHYKFLRIYFIIKSHQPAQSSIRFLYFDGLLRQSQLLIAFQHIMEMVVSVENKMPVPNAMSSNPEAIEMLHYILSLSRASFSDWHCSRAKPVTYFQRLLYLPIEYRDLWWNKCSQTSGWPSDRIVGITYSSVFTVPSARSCLTSLFGMGRGLFMTLSIPSMTTKLQKLLTCCFSQNL